MHLGLIGGIGPAATMFYYQGLVRAHVAGNQPLNLTIAHADLRELMRNMTDGASQQQAQSFGRLTERLKSAGADVVAITSIAGHFCIHDFARLSPLPIDSALSALEVEFARRKLRRAGLLGTRSVMASRLYGLSGLSSVELVVPEDDQYNAIHEIYVAMATAGQATQQQRERLFEIGRDLIDKQGAEAVVLGGTDMFLAFGGHDCGYEVIDSAEVHIDALYRLSSQPS